MWSKEATCTPRSTEENVGCMQGIFNMFYVYPGSGTRKLLSDGPRRSKWYLKKKKKPKLLTSVDDKREGSNRDGQCESGEAKLGAANVNSLKKGKASKQIPDTQGQPRVPDLASASHSDKNLNKRNKNSGRPQKANNVSVGSSLELHRSHRLQKDEEEFSNVIHVDALLEGLYNNTHKDQRMHGNSKNRIHLHPSEGIRTSEMFDSLDRHDLQLPQDDPVLERTLDEVLESIILNKVANPNQPTTSGATNQSEDLKNVLETLRSSKDLLLEVLQDPKIVNLLLVKHFDSQQNSNVSVDHHTAENELFEKEISTKKSEASPGHCSLQKPMIHDNFRKDEPKDSRPSKEFSNSQRPSRIVILKPNQMKDRGFSDINEPRSPSHSLYSSSPNSENEVVSFHFIVHEIKRKLKQVFGMTQRQQQLLSTEEACYRSPSDSHVLDDLSDTSEYLKADDLLGPSGVEQEALLPSESSRAMSVESQLCTEPKLSSHIDGDGDECLDTRKVSKSLEDTIYIPDYVIVSGIDLIKDKMPILPPQQMIYSSSKQSPTCENVLNWTVQSRMQSENLDHDSNSSIAELEMFHLSSKVIKTHTQEVVVTEEIAIPKDFTIQGDEPDTKSACAKTNSEGTLDIPEETFKKDDSSSWSSLDFFKDPSKFESPAVPSAPTVVKQKILASEGTGKPEKPSAALVRESLLLDKVGTGKPEKPSAALVRESLLLDKVLKPGSCKSVHVTSQFRISPRKPRIQQHDDSVINVTTTSPETSLQLCVGDDDFKFEYMKALLEASDFCHSIVQKREKTSSKLLDPSLYDEIETPSGEIPDDLKLFFDCIVEVLEEIYESSSSFMPLLSFIDTSLRPFPSGEKLVQEAWRVLNIHFVPWFPTTLEKTIKKDLKNQTWMDIRCSVGEIGVTLGDDIFDEILEETILELWD